MESNDTSPVTGEHLSPKLIFNNQAQKFIRNLAPTMEEAVEMWKSEAFDASQETGLQPSPKREVNVPKVMVQDIKGNFREPNMPKDEDPEDEDDEDMPLLKKSGSSSKKRSYEEAPGEKTPAILTQEAEEMQTR